MEQHVNYLKTTAASRLSLAPCPRCPRVSPCAPVLQLVWTVHQEHSQCNSHSNRAQCLELHYRNAKQPWRSFWHDHTWATLLGSNVKKDFCPLRRCHLGLNCFWRHNSTQENKEVSQVQFCCMLLSKGSWEVKAKVFIYSLNIRLWLAVLVTGNNLLCRWKHNEQLLHGGRLADAHQAVLSLLLVSKTEKITLNFCGSK